MKIRCVLCHPTDLMESEERQVFLINCARDAGHDAAVYAMCVNTAVIAASHSPTGQAVEYFPVDTKETSPHDTTSAPLLERLELDTPDLILIKGIDYAMAASIRARLPSSRIGAIIGGTYEHPFLHECAVIFFETSRQLARYHGPAHVQVLPKFIRWEEVPPFSAHRVTDIVNVGNFNETRKAQELLLPFTHRHSVLFIGSGARLDSIKALCADRPEVEFAGYIERSAVFQKVSRSRLMVHCSTWDGYPRAVAESLACGVPVVVLDGVVDLIEGENIIQGFSLDELYPQTFSLLQDQERLADLGARARHYMEQQSSYENLRRIFLETIVI